MAETALAVVGLIGPTYDAIKSAYDLCRSMQNYGRDMRDCLQDLSIQWATFEELMHRPVCDCQQPFDLTDENDKTTRIILAQLGTLEHQFGVCSNIVQRLCRSPEQGVLSLHRHSPLGKPISRAVMAATLMTGFGHSDLLLPTSPIRKRSKYLISLSPELDMEYSKFGRNCTSLRCPSPSSGESEGICSHSNTWTRLTWALHDKSEMETAIARIRVTISDLGGFLRLRAPRESHKIIPENMIKATPQVMTNPLKSLYMNVHRALCEANKRSKRKVSFSICALEGLDQNWDRLENQTKLHLRLGCVALWLQMHIAAEESTFWIAEVRHPDESPMSESINEPLVESLDELSHAEGLSDGEEYYEVGAMRHKFESRDKIHFFAHTSPCRRQQTLREILASEDTCSKLSDMEILRLCLTVVVAHENMTDVRTTTRDITLDDYVFYQSSDLSPEHMIHDLDVTCPYLHFGFGEPSTCSKKMGLTANSSKSSDASIVGLGVVLIQVAARQSIPGIQQKDSKIDANAQGLIEKALEKIGFQFGDGVTNAIYACLTGNSRSENELIRKISGVLRQLQDSFLS